MLLEDLLLESMFCNYLSFSFCYTYSDNSDLCHALHWFSFYNVSVFSSFFTITTAYSHILHSQIHKIEVSGKPLTFTFTVVQYFKSSKNKIELRFYFIFFFKLIIVKMNIPLPIFFPLKFIISRYVNLHSFIKNLLYFM